VGIRKVIFLSIIIGLFMSGNSYALDPVSSDQFQVHGEIGVGGYYDTKDDIGFWDNWVTGVDLFVNYQNGPIHAYVEIDIDYVYGDNIDHGFNSDLDKGWIGYDFGYGMVSYGVENDTALDAVDGAGDFTVEFGQSAADVSDAFNVIKIQKHDLGFVYGFSYFDTDTDFKGSTDTGLNGYIGYKTELIGVYGGYEKRDSDHEVYVLSGHVLVRQIKLGLNLYRQDKINYNSDLLSETQEGFYTSAAMDITPRLNIATGYGSSETDNDSNKDTSAANASLIYTPMDHWNAEFDIKHDFEESETTYFANIYYSF